MESKNYKIEKNFISDSEAEQIRKWIEIDGLSPEFADPNHHLIEIAKSINGVSMIFDISNTNITEYITKFQSVHKVKSVVPDFIKNIVDRVADFNQLPKEHIFLQVIDMKKGGKINPHYDASINGYINYKCNISVLSEDYDIFIGDTSVKIEEKDLYCFEASLYKHWTNEFNSRRIFLSIGFIIPYSVVGRDENDPRVRLSKRIEKYFQNL
jgi:hypothetical protein